MHFASQGIEFWLQGIPALIMWTIMAIPFAIGAWFVAGRMGRSRVLWVILTLIPVVNVFFYIYAMFAVLLYVLDRLNQVAPRSGSGASA